MRRNIAIGIQDFEDIIQNDYFYIDKTEFIREWWESGDSVTLIARPRRFGKTLNMSMVNRFFSNKYKEKGDVFEGLSIWTSEKFRQLQGSYPVLNLSFANVKEDNFEATEFRIREIIKRQYEQFAYLADSEMLSDAEKEYFNRMRKEPGILEAPTALNHLCDFLYRYHGKKVIILLDEYDTPMQEAYVHGYWDELVGVTRSLFNATFKTNPYMERGLMTGITRVSKESVFSDLNNLEVVTTTSDRYATAFGFTEEEVFCALDEVGLGAQKDEVKSWYDGFVFGKHRDIYNPWSILNYMDKNKLTTYWANTSSNNLIGKLIRESDYSIKQQFEQLLRGECMRTPIDEQIVYNQLDGNAEAIWSLLLASGYLKVNSYESYREVEDGQRPKYELELTNLEVRKMFEAMVNSWFAQSNTEYNGFIKAMFQGDLDAMNDYMSEVTLNMFSYFDTGANPSQAKPESFYHGFVLGLLVDLQNKYYVTSNRESGFGRYDVMLEPKNPMENNAVILEFKILNKRRESSLEETVRAALKQIEEKQYAAYLIERGIRPGNIYKYGVAFSGKEVLIDGGIV